MLNPEGFTCRITTSLTSSLLSLISDHLVTFWSLEELQEQNQRLLAVVWTISEEKEKEEEEEHD